MALMAGGGIRGGQVIGATDRNGAAVIARPVHYQDVIATLYRNLGIDPAQTTLVHMSGRPQHVVDLGRVIQEVV